MMQAAAAERLKGSVTSAYCPSDAQQHATKSRAIDEPPMSLLVTGPEHPASPQPGALHTAPPSVFAHAKWLGMCRQVALAAVAKNLCCLTVPAFLCLRKLPRRQHWAWTIAQVGRQTAHEATDGSSSATAARQWLRSAWTCPSEPCFPQRCHARCACTSALTPHCPAQGAVLVLSLGAVGFGSYASLTALQQQAQVTSLSG